MEEITQKILGKKYAIISALIGIFFGILYNIFFIGEEIGISYFIFFSGIISLILYFGKKTNTSFKKYDYILMIYSLFLSLFLGILYSSFISFTNIFFSFLCLILLIRNIFNNESKIGLLDSLLTPLLLIILGKNSYDETIKSFKIENISIFRRIFIGIVISIPVIFVFGNLLYNGDLVFKYFIDNTIGNLHFPEINSEFIGRIIVFILTSLFISGVINSFVQQKLLELKPKNEINRNLGLIEAKIFIGSIILLFGIYILVQIGYIIAGDQIILNSGFTYAEYAKKGYYELGFISFVSYLLILCVYNQMKLTDNKKDKILIYMLIFTIIQIGFLIISSIFRLSLYENAYGYTLLRFYGFVILMWLFIVFLGLIYRIYKDLDKLFFTKFVIITTLTIQLMINFINPDNFIAGKNIEKHLLSKDISSNNLVIDRSSSVRLDGGYIYNQLSRDAVSNSIKLIKISNLTDSEKIIYNDQLKILYDNISKEKTSFYNFNYSTYKAKKLIKENFGINY